VKSETATGEETGASVVGKRKSTGFFRAIWGFFASMKTAVVFLLVLAVVSVYGTLVEQYPALRVFGVTDLYHTVFYTFLLALIGISLAVCSINRFGSTWRAMFHPKVTVSDKQIAGMMRAETLSWAGDVGAAADKAETALRAGSYHLLRADENGVSVLYAARGRLSIWGPYLTHLSVLVIFVGAILGNRLGLDGITVIKEGGYTDTAYVRKTEREKDLGFRVALQKFTIQHDAQHNPTAYQSDLEILDGGRLVTRKVIDVNHPLTYEGVSFFQSDYGLTSVLLKVTGPNGETAWLPFDVDTQTEMQRKRYSMPGIAFKQITMGRKKLTVYVRDIVPDYIGGEEINASDLPINPAILVMVNDRLPEYKGLDAWSDRVWLTESESASLKGYKITLDNVADYTVLQVVRNPGLPIVYTGFGLMLVGVFVSFYVTRKVVRIRVSASKTGALVAVGATSRADASAFDGDFARLHEAFGHKTS
jgi:cytochrome c biogenesis protein